MIRQAEARDRGALEERIEQIRSDTNHFLFVCERDGRVQISMKLRLRGFLYIHANHDLIS
ncbi:hypothetical protein [Paenibacillus rigui]|uniref:Uncharacterized protein n=1 Tax=Paenibacillus rigui TaxID=554312 RepID=A0A229UPI6_9BACL|nr:hypothetical protein [Paenibacillus rigui]OXM85191.1 hypothetical protein CF651_16465 [Paenibacillus rigui]